MSDNPLSNISSIFWQKEINYQFRLTLSGQPECRSLCLLATIVRSGAKDFIEIQAFGQRWTKRPEAGRFKVLESESLVLMAYLKPTMRNGKIKCLKMLIDVSPRMVGGATSDVLFGASITLFSYTRLADGAILGAAKNGNGRSADAVALELSTGAYERILSEAEHRSLRALKRQN